MNYTASRFYPMFKELDTLQPIENGTKEIIGMSVELDMNEAEPLIVFNNRKTNREYLNQEAEWYASKNNSISLVDNVKIWQQISDDTKQVNSNYGQLVYGKSNFNQFEHAYQTLVKDKHSREAIIIYNRPSIHLESTDLNGHDFICTMYQHFFIRDNTLHCITNMRSNDAIFGLFNDWPWFYNVYTDMYARLKEVYPHFKRGIMIYRANSFHVYERHYKLLHEIVNGE